MTGWRLGFVARSCAVLPRGSPTPSRAPRESASGRRSEASTARRPTRSACVTSSSIGAASHQLLNEVRRDLPVARRRLLRGPTSCGPCHDRRKDLEERPAAERSGCGGAGRYPLRPRVPARGSTSASAIGLDRAIQQSVRRWPTSWRNTVVPRPRPPDRHPEAQGTREERVRGGAARASSQPTPRSRNAKARETQRRKEKPTAIQAWPALSIPWLYFASLRLRAFAIQPWCLET